MNERIRELSEQAKDWKLGNGGMDYLAVDLEKFAELILLEATDIVYDMLDDNTGAEVVVRVKEHFGVE